MEKIIIFISRLIRLPIAVMAVIFVIIISLLSSALEVLIALVWFVFLSIFSEKDRIVNSWIYSYPNSMRSIMIHLIILNIFIWTWNVDKSLDYRDYGEACGFDYSENAPLGFKTGWCFFIFTAISALLTAITVYRLWLPAVALMIVLFIIFVIYFLCNLPKDK